jgi:hypothetical protein
MKSILVLFTIALVGCAPPKGADPVEHVTLPTLIIQPVDHSCNVIDTCTYNGTLNRQPRYICNTANFVASEHPEMDPALFAGKECLTAREDYHLQNSFCGPMNFPCQIQVQGPGAPAL